MVYANETFYALLQGVLVMVNQINTNTYVVLVKRQVTLKACSICTVPGHSRTDSFNSGRAGTWGRTQGMCESPSWLGRPLTL